jgi:methionyl-tRNA formyltransferase
VKSGERKLRIVFMGTPEFAVPSLRLLIDRGFDIAGVVTAPDKPRGRGQVLGASPVKEVALAEGIPVLQPERLKSPEFLEELRALKADLQVVVAFRMLPEQVWAMPEYGTFNLHASLLPHYRGAAPINWAIINGERMTGVTTFFIRQEIDTGTVILQEEEPISDHDTAGTLHDRLMVKGAQLVLRTVRAIAAGNPERIEQPHGGVYKTAPKILREHCRIDWHQGAEQIRNLVRGLCPFPSAWTELGGKVYKIHALQLAGREIAGPPGRLVTDGKSFICISTGDRPVEILEIQAEGKRRMTAVEFLRGNRL